MKAIQIFQLCDPDKHKYLRLLYLHYSQRMSYYVLVRKKFILKELYQKAVIPVNNVQCNSLISSKERCNIQIKLNKKLSGWNKERQINISSLHTKKKFFHKISLFFGICFVFNVLLKYVFRIIRLCCIIPQRLISFYVFVTYRSLYLYLQSL